MDNSHTTCIAFDMHINRRSALFPVGPRHSSLVFRCHAARVRPRKRRASFTYNESLKEFSELGPEEREDR